MISIKSLSTDMLLHMYMVRGSNLSCSIYDVILDSLALEDSTRSEKPPGYRLKGVPLILAG